MDLLTDLFKYALSRYYPDNTHTIEDTVYLSKKENYNNWFNSVYINGKWYIADETLDGIIDTVGRNISEVFLLYRVDTANEYGYGVGVVLKDFKKNHLVEGVIDEAFPDDATPFTLSGFKELGNGVYIGGQVFYGKLPKTIKVSAPEIVDSKNYTKYNSVPARTYNLFEGDTTNIESYFNQMSSDRFLNEYPNIVPDFDFSYKFDTVKRQEDELIDVNALYFKSNFEGVLVIISNEEGKEDVRMNIPANEVYMVHPVSEVLDCYFEFEDGLKIYFNANVTDGSSWKKINKYIIDY